MKELFCQLTVLIPLVVVCSRLNLEVNAQILPDSTLGNESSVVTPLDPITERIDGGASRGANLFHSFREFNIQEGSTAYFANPAAIQTIFSRVTGNNPSRLFGTLGVLGNANLFFINPNGIIFGPNARLDISGSFIGSTANSIIFPDGSRFSATNPGAAPLLTIDVPIPLGLEFEGGEPRSIINAATLESGGNLALVGGTVVSTGSITVPKNVSLLTVGEGVMTTVELDNEGTYLGKVIQPLIESFQSISSGSKLIQLVLQGGEATGLTITPEGQVRVVKTDIVVETGDIVTVGEVKAQDLFGGGLIVIDSQKDIKLNGKVDASSFDISKVLAVPKGTYLGDGGDITLIARGNIIATNNILAKGVLGGDISFSSGETVNLNDGLEVNVRSGGEGNITINARNVEMLDGSALRAGIDVGLGSPDAVGGDIVINATESVTLDGGSLIANVLNINAIGTAGNINITTSSLSLLNGSSFSNSTFKDSQGNAGNINITTNILSMQNGSRLFATTVGSGNAGNININTRIAEIDNSFLTSGVSVTIDEQGNLISVGKGNGGDINITTESLSLSNSSQLDSNTLGEGNAGNININTRTAEMNNSSLASAVSVETDEQGNIISVGKGNGGNITITTESLILSNGAQLISGTLGEGKAGDININTRTAEIDNSFLTSGVSVTTDEQNNIIAVGKGNGGDVTITTESLMLSNSAQLISGTLGEGNAGDININASNTVTLDGFTMIVDEQGNPQPIYSGVISSVEQGAKGLGGNITIATDSLVLSNGAFLNVGTSGQGNAGNINITTNHLTLQNDSELTAATVGIGDAGNININARITEITESSKFSSEVAVRKDGQGNFIVGKGDAGDINITTDTLTLQNDSSLVASTQGEGNAGNVFIDAHNRISLDGESAIFTIVDENGLGKGGNITITTGSLSLMNRSQIIAGVDGEGEAGVIRIEARNDVSIIGIKPIDEQDDEPTAIFNRLDEGGKGRAGDIYITTGSFLLDGAVIQSFTNGEGDAGNIDIDAETITLINDRQSRASGISSFIGFKGIGKGGDVTLNAESVSLQNSSIQSSTLGEGDAGNITVNARDTITLSDVSFLGTAVLTTGTGRGGDIIINARSLSLQNTSFLASSLFTDAGGRGKAGNIIINVSDSVTLNNNSSFLASVDENATGDGGDITINARAVSLDKNSSLGTLTFGNGNPGNIQINNAESILVSNSSFIDATVGSTAMTTRSSNIELNTDKLSLVNNSSITSSTSGQGDAGKIAIEAKEVNLDNGRILTQAASRTGGNITLDLQNLLTLRNNSQISTTAGTAQAGGDGGNIDIATRFIVTSPFENSDITANAFLGSGGNINITTLGIFGLEVRDTLTPLSDITASSAFGLDGEINIDNLGIDPTRGIESLPQEVVNPQVFQGCQTRDGEAISEFYRLGRGGIPSSPDDWLNEAPFGNEGLMPLEIPLNKIPLQINWKDIPADGVSLSCQPSVSQR